MCKPPGNLKTKLSTILPNILSYNWQMHMQNANTR
jgi:hypothetical protein